MERTFKEDLRRQLGREIRGGKGEMCLQLKNEPVSLSNLIIIHKSSNRKTIILYMVNSLMCEKVL